MARGDAVLYRYEADVFPDDPSAGWDVFDPCTPSCVESLDSGHFVATWAQADDRFNYTYIIAQSPVQPPPTLWVEWRFRSNHAFGPNSFNCDGSFVVDFKSMNELIDFYGDTAIGGGGGDDVIEGLNINQFHTYRFESLDGMNFSFAVDGTVFTVGAEFGPDNGLHFLQFYGLGGCNGDWFPNMVNEWDFVRYGTIDTGETIIATDPPAGILNPAQYTGLDRFSVTFDAPNFAYVDDITVEVSQGTPPVVLRTWRLENHDVDTMEVVLDRPLAFNTLTRFIFNDGVRSNVVEYTLANLPPIPTTSTWSVVVMTLSLLTAGTLMAQRRESQRSQFAAISFRTV